MERTRTQRFTRCLTQLIALVISLSLLAACGGGGGGGFDPATHGGDGPPADPPINPPPPGGGDPGGGDPGGGDPGGGDPGGGDPGGGDPGGGDPGGGDPIVPPTEPAPLPVFGPHQDAHAIATLPNGDTFFADAATGDLYRKTAAETVFNPVANIGAGARAMAHSPSGVLYVAFDGGGSPDSLVGVALADYQLSAIGPIGTRTGIESLAWDQNSGTLYAVDMTAAELVTLDLGTGAPTLVGALGGGFANVSSLTMDETDGLLLGVDAAQDKVVRIDPSTGAATQQQSLPSGAALTGFAHDVTSNMFFGASAGNQNVATLDIKGVGIDWATMLGMATDEASGMLYGSHVSTGWVVEINPANQWKRVIGYTGIPMMEGLAYDQTNQVLYGISSDTKSLYTISTTDGTTTLVGSLTGAGGPWNNLSGLAWGGGLLYAVDTDNADILQVDPSNAAAILIGTATGFAGMQSLTWDAGQAALRSYDDVSQNDLIIDPANASVPTPGGVTGLGAIGGLAWTTNGPKMFGTATGSNQLVTVFDHTPPTLAHGDIAGLALDANSGTLLGVDAVTDEVVTVDAAQQSSTQATSMPGSLIEGMTYDDAMQVYWMVDNISQTLMSMNAGFSVQQVGNLGDVGTAGIRALAFDPNAQILYGVDSDSDELVIINRTTGVASPVNPGQNIGFGTIEALAYDADQNKLMGVDRTTRAYVEINVATGVATQVGTVAGTAVGALTYDPVNQVMLAIDADEDRVAQLHRDTGATLP